MNKRLLISLFFIVLSYSSLAKDKNKLDFSTAGFYVTPNSGRTVQSMNVGWHFLLGDSDAWTVDYDDKMWDIVSVPNGMEVTSPLASGCSNYRGVAWYRKHFNTNKSMIGKRNYIYFEAVMGKCKIWLNGTLVGEHFGGFLPIIIDVTEYLNFENENIIAVRSDNSDDPMFPPGKPQNMLDFNYSGGIYRDVWMVSHNKEIYITDANVEDEVAGGGLFVWCEDVTDKDAKINMRLHTRNGSDQRFKGIVKYRLCSSLGDIVASTSNDINIDKKGAVHTINKFMLHDDKLKTWSPQNPYLYWLEVDVCDNKGVVVDGYKVRVGVRSIEFRGLEGLYLNGKPYGKPLIGANRHQDFAVIGNALPNSLHWRDAKKLRDVGLEIIRNAHYPQDPAFMDACDELGLFVIVNTPGWQFWNKEPVFENRVYSDIRNMIRRDRNRPSILMWEPILNETHYPEYFAKNVNDITLQEYPYKGCYTSSDETAKGSELFPIIFSHPKNEIQSPYDPKKSYFTREWGDNVDDWNSHNSPSRVSRAWGEIPMLVQANHYAHPEYNHTSLKMLYEAYPKVLGGTLWHSFDHQRGYHPDPFYGGIMDAYRQPKYSYYMFASQRENRVNGDIISDSGPMVYIAHEMSPFSGKDVYVYSNCDEIVLTYLKDGKQYTYYRGVRKNGEMPSPIIKFEGVYDFMQDKALSRQGKQNDVWMIAEGKINGETVATHKVMPARRPSKLILWVDDENTEIMADGNDIVTVVAAMADANGNIKRLTNHSIKFEIEGEGIIVGSAHTTTNPIRMEWGTAPILVRTTTTPGNIKIKASMLFDGELMPTAAEIVFSSVRSRIPMIFTEEYNDPSVNTNLKNKNKSDNELQNEIDRLKKELNTIKLKEVEAQQEHFGEKEI